MGWALGRYLLIIVSRISHFTAYEVGIITCVLLFCFVRSRGLENFFNDIDHWAD